MGSENKKSKTENEAMVGPGGSGLRPHQLVGCKTFYGDSEKFCVKVGGLDGLN